jgi:hypothetical protein
MLVEGMGCEKTEENRQMGFRLLSLAADQNEPNALLAMRQVCIMQGDNAGVQYPKRHLDFFSAHNF